MKALACISLLIAILAAEYGHADHVDRVIKGLIDNRKIADLSLASAVDGTTPLFMAAQGGHLQIVNTLVKVLLDNDRGDDLNLATIGKLTALWAAVSNGHLDHEKYPEEDPLVGLGSDLSAEDGEKAFREIEVELLGYNQRADAMVYCARP